ncbi:MAG: hypothetical protein JWQ27_2595 [Ferruginibacter sp.]|nr:hypothetical protein [Ferruginibacter sp.]
MICNHENISLFEKARVKAEVFLVEPPFISSAARCQSFIFDP